MYKVVSNNACLVFTVEYPLGPDPLKSSSFSISGLHFHDPGLLILFQFKCHNEVPCFPSGAPMLLHFTVPWPLLCSVEVFFESVSPIHLHCELPSNRFSLFCYSIAGDMLKAEPLIAWLCVGWVNLKSKGMGTQNYLGNQLQERDWKEDKEGG